MRKHVIKKEDKRIGIKAFFEKSHRVYLVITVVPVIILVALIFYIAMKYNQLSVEIENAVEQHDRIKEDLMSELWDLISNKITLEESTHEFIISDVSRNLEKLDENTHIIAAQRALDTLKIYVAQLEQQIMEGDAVSYNEHTYDEIVNVSDLVCNMLEEYIITSETSTISLLNSRMKYIALVVTMWMCSVLAYFIVFVTKDFRSTQNSIDKSILALNEMTSQIARGNLKVRLRDSGIVEFESLTDSLNSMADQLDKLIDYRIQVRGEIQKAEMRALQAQITPHFIYNTLETAVWLAEEERNEEVVKVIMAFTTFLRISLIEGDYIPVRKEIEHIENYLEIQNIRYYDILTYEIQVDPGLNQYRILKQLLQPLVENSLYHGIKEKRSTGKGLIRISGADNHNGTMTFTVEDNGGGMQPERLEALRQKLEKSHRDKEDSIGLLNVNKRIQLYYNSDGLKVESILGSGTRVYFTIPCEENEYETYIYH
ncbi:sensor histidine kinase [Ruminococcus sp. OA3]|uniref:sensor histidine kinase n=1 Tax=Ruminococcus sp. OA3 TaxID=2914164 RepID=UPI001F070F31|nr:sensor histidine kinase [Ruminococcus sp. OA3]MCH1981356.1 sensor histidine kinase [Ruminococcus sp. OA3]